MLIYGVDYWYTKDNLTRCQAREKFVSSVQGRPRRQCVQRAPLHLAAFDEATMSDFCWDFCVDHLFSHVMRWRRKC